MPRPETVDQALEEIKKSTANYQHFFEVLNFPSWIAPLAAKGRFRNPPSAVPVDGGVTFPGWPESAYLARMATIPAAQQEVLQVVVAIPETENINVHNDLLNVALALPPALSAKLVRQARTWVQSPYQGLAKYRIGDLIAHLATGGEAGPALQLARDTFALPPRAPQVEDDDGLLSPEPRGWLEDWYYEEALKKAIPALTAANPRGTLELFVGLLVTALEASHHKNEEKHEDYSHVWHEAIERDEQPPRVQNSLISAVRNTAEQAIQQAPDNTAMVLRVLRQQEWAVFRRIELHLLRQFAATMLDEIIRIAPDLVDLEGPTRHEAALLLAQAFPLLPPGTQEAVLQRIEDGPDDADTARWLQFMGDEPSPEKITEYGTHWQAQRLALIGDHVPEAWRQRVQATLTRAGTVRRPDELERGGVWHGPTSPKTTDELFQMGPAQVLEYLREWTPESGHFTPSQEGLGRTLADVIARDLDGYVSIAERFRTVDPTFVRFFFNSLETASKAEQTFAWEPVLALASWVVEQPRTIPGRHRVLMEADPDWSWTRGTIATLLEAGMQQRPSELPFTQREPVWQVLDPLTTDPDPTLEHEAKYGGKNMDPATMAINTVRGKALNAVVVYALWVRRHLDKITPPPPLCFDAMPEVQRVLDEHLNTDREPTLTIRSIYGRFFPWLQHLDGTWARDNVERIFPRLPEEVARFNAAWETFLLYCEAFKEVLPVLRAQYAQAITALGSVDPKSRRGTNPEVRIGVHLVTYYWQGALALHDDLLTDFYGGTSDELRSAAMEYIGRSLTNTPQEIPAAIAKRLKEFWEWRLTTATGAPDISPYRRELAKFGWWFASRKYDDQWSLQQLRSVLSATQRIEPDFKVAETLETLAPAFPQDTVFCVARMVEGDRRDWTVIGNRDHIEAIIKVALASGDLDAKATAERLVEYLVGRGHFEYRRLLP